MQFLDNNKVSRKDRVREHIAHLAAEFFRIESNRQSMITVTRADLSPNFSHSTVYFTVLPQSYEREALNFAKRKRPDFKKYVKARVNMRRIPFFDFAIDEGEKHRQRIQDISQHLDD